MSDKAGQAASPLDIALRILTGREHSEAQLRRKLAKRGIGREAISETLTRLRELAYIDDRRFARLLIRDRVGMRKRGWYDARAQLGKAGVDHEIIDAVCEEMADDFNELAIAELAAKKKLGMLREPDARKRREKLARHLASRGFSPDTVRQTLDAFSDDLKHEDSDDDLDG